MVIAARRRLTLVAITAALSALVVLGGGALAESQEVAAPPVAKLAFPAAAEVPPSGRSGVAVIVLENKSFSQVIGNPAAPYMNSLARRYALATHFHAVAHPSLPDYLALAAGSTLGMGSDCIGCKFGGPNLLSQLSSAGISWKVYVAGVRSSCYRGRRAPGYVKPLDPAVYFTRVVRSPAQCSNIVPLTRLPGDLRRGSLPDFSWLTLSLCQDTHFCRVSSGDRFLSRLVPPLLRSLGPHGTLMILWDEGARGGAGGASAGGGHVPAIVAGPDVRRGARIGVPINQYSVLRALEGRFGLRPLRHARAVPTAAWRGLLAGA